MVGMESFTPSLYEKSFVIWEYNVTLPNGPKYAASFYDTDCIMFDRMARLGNKIDIED